ncbi:MAG TPA: tetratricopeptide repeat protein [Pyrinomonadaceae bacterium]
MKTCPTCARVYANDALRFCRHDGAPLAAAPEDETRLLYAEDATGAPQQTGGLSDELAAHAAATSSSLTAPMPAQRRRAARRRAIDSLAVLPFTNEGGEATTGYLSDGITEGIINSLSQLPRLRVLPRSTVFRHRAASADPLGVGRQLGVRAVLTGRVAEVGGWLVIRAELIDVREESQLWGEQYRREPADIFALQEEISRDISEKLRLKLTGDERLRLSKRYTENTDAYRAYLQGRHYVTSKRTADWIRKGIDCFQRAIDLDPNYALAYSGLAEAHGLLASSTGEQPPRDEYPKAQAAARKALALDPSLAEAHTALGFSLLLYDYDLDGARRAFRRAVRLNPNHPNAHDGLAFYYNATSQAEKSVAECEESRRLDPLSPFPEVNLGWAHYFARRYDAAAAQGRKALEMDARFAFAHWIIGLALAQSGDAAGAVESFERGVETSGGGLTFRAHLAYAYARAGRETEARRALAELEKTARRRYVSAYYFAVARLGLNERDAALERLERALEERAGFLAFLPVEPVFDALRDDARFRQLVERVGVKG